jgi:CRP-like cAMP-binding protein
VDRGSASVRTRASRVLEHLADAYGRPVSEGILIDIPLPQRDLASLTAASEKGISRAYEQLRHAGAITVAYRRITVRDPHLLHEYAEDRAPGPGAADRRPDPGADPDY